MICIVGAYAADEPDGPSRGSQYISAKDIKVIAVVLVVLILLMTPIYRHYREESLSSQCLKNIGAMAKAIALYAEDYTGRFPPAYVTGAGEEPVLFKGKPFTWASLVQDRMNPRSSFLCPAAKEEEIVVAAHPTSANKTVPMAYGMYVALSSAPIDQIMDPGNTVVIAETSNRGANDTYDPSPLVSPDGVVSPVDGFLIGYDTGNREPFDRSRFVTRLAFPGSKGGVFGSETQARHTKLIHVLFAGGQAGTIEPKSARIQWLGSDIVGLWATR